MKTSKETELNLEMIKELKDESEANIQNKRKYISKQLTN